MQRTAKFIIRKPLAKISRALLLGLALASSAIPARADSLEDLRASGAIGESYNGYAVAREPSARKEADEINAKRRSIYQEKAIAQGIDIEQVGKVYAEEIIRKVPPGTWIQINGQWKRK